MGIAGVVATGWQALKPNRMVMQGALPLGILRLFGGLVFVWMLETSTNTSFVGAMSGLSVVLMALLSALLLKERQDFGLKMLASTLCLTGIPLV